MAKRIIPEDISLQVALCSEYKRYLSRFEFPKGFWLWAVGDDGVVGATERFISREEINNQIQFFAQNEEFLDQIREQNELALKAPKVFRRPLRMAFEICGMNAEHKQQLSFKHHGLWAIEDVLQVYKKQAQDLQSAWASALSRGERVPDQPPSKWPWRSIYTFFMDDLPYERPWIDEVWINPALLASYLANPGVRGSEALVLGWQCKVMFTAARAVQREIDQAEIDALDDWAEEED